ncbi:hypothetical protein [Gramella sp. KN1008]|uniref:hypothetical protein n=1 Tax=Gramella sp. KN1008 TaxID=2529298 RepID=UPI00103F9108|nr:hypothetical protein [Gramella sp. KN1008]TBW29932.1 hypothetical protein EZJ28_00565 [Gramella sp. KN1008]
MSKLKNVPEQDQEQPGDEFKMHPEPEIIRDDYRGSNKLKGSNSIMGQVIHINGGEIIGS